MTPVVTFTCVNESMALFWWGVKTCWFLLFEDYKPVSECENTKMIAFLIYLTSTVMHHCLRSQ